MTLVDDIASDGMLLLADDHILTGWPHRTIQR